MTQTFYVDPTQVSNGTGSVGSPFNSLNNAVSALATPFETATEDYVINCLAGNDTYAFDVDWDIGAGGSARKIIIRADGANRHTGIRGTGYRMQSRLLIKPTSNIVGAEVYGIAAKCLNLRGPTGTQLVHDGCLSFDAPNEGFVCAGGTIIRRNCISVGSGSNAFDSGNGDSVPTVTDINCTVMGSGGYGFNSTAGTHTAVNCYSGGNVTGPYNGTITKTNCAHDTAGVFTGSTASVAYSTANFTNVTAASENAKLASGSALIAAGVGPGSNASVPTEDFEGTARAGSTTDIGADQRTAAGGTTITPASALVTVSGRAPTTSAFNNVRIREVLVNESGQVVGGAANITLLVWYSGRFGGAPDISLNGMTTDAAGTTSWSIATGTLAYNQPIAYVAQDSISFSNYTCARMIPSYE